MHSREMYSGRLQELEIEENNLERYLNENSALLSSAELDGINSRLIGIRAEKQELDELVTGGFY